MASGARVFVTVTQPYRSSYTPTTRGSAPATPSTSPGSSSKPGCVTCSSGTNRTSRASGAARSTPCSTRSCSPAPMTGSLRWACGRGRSRPPGYGTTKLIQGVGAWYRRSKRPRPLFHGVSRHPYSLPARRGTPRTRGGRCLHRRRYGTPALPLRPFVLPDAPIQMALHVPGRLRGAWLGNQPHE